MPPEIYINRKPFFAVCLMDGRKCFISTQNGKFLCEIPEWPFPLILDLQIEVLDFAQKLSEFANQAGTNLLARVVEIS